MNRPHSLRALAAWTAIAPLALASLAEPVRGAQHTVPVAVDCEPIPGLAQGRHYRHLRRGVALNDSGLLAFADAQAGYAVDLGSGSLTEVLRKRTVVSSPAGGPASLVSGFTGRIAVNSHGALLWETALVPLETPSACFQLEVCGTTPDTQPQECIASVNGLVFVRDASRSLIFRSNFISGRKVLDFDLLESSNGILALSKGPEDDPWTFNRPVVSRINYFGTESIYLVGEDLAHDPGDPAPEGQGTYLGFGGVTSGVHEPLAVAATIRRIPYEDPRPGSAGFASFDSDLSAPASKLYSSVPECESFLPLIGQVVGLKKSSSLDRGRVTCGPNPCGAGDIVWIGHVGDCLGTGGLGGYALIQTNLIADSSTVLLATGVHYPSLDLGSGMQNTTLLEIGLVDNSITSYWIPLASDPNQVSASALPDFGSLDGAAVFLGEIAPAGQPSGTAAILVCTGPGEVYVVARVGDPMPGTTGNFYSFSQPVINAQGRIAFWAVSDTVHPVDGRTAGVFLVDLADLLAGL